MTRTEDRLIDGHTGETVEVECSDAGATKARRDWLRKNGYRCRPFNPEGRGSPEEMLHTDWIMAKSEVFGWPAITKERQEMEAIEYFHPYENGSNRPD